MEQMLTGKQEAVAEKAVQLIVNHMGLRGSLIRLIVLEMDDVTPMALSLALARNGLREEYEVCEAAIVDAELVVEIEERWSK